MLGDTRYSMGWLRHALKEVHLLNKSVEKGLNFTRMSLDLNVFCKNKCYVITVFYSFVYEFSNATLKKFRLSEKRVPYFEEGVKTVTQCC